MNTAHVSLLTYIYLVLLVFMPDTDTPIMLTKFEIKYQQNIYCESAKKIGADNQFWSCRCACLCIHNKEIMCNLISIVLILFSPSIDMRPFLSHDGKLIISNGFNTNKTQLILLCSSLVMIYEFEYSKENFVACGGINKLFRSTIRSINHINLRKNWYLGMDTSSVTDSFMRENIESFRGFNLYYLECVVIHFSQRRCGVSYTQSDQ